MRKPGEDEMSSEKAIRVLKETPTEYGYCIREEYWPGFSGEVVALSEDDDASEFARDLQNMIDDGPSEMFMTTCYTDDGYWIGDLETARFLCEERGISPRPSDGVERGILRPCNHGWCEREQKWYGWSHRAIYGFGIGSEVKRGDCAYVPTDMEDAKAGAIRFWTEDDHEDVRANLAEDEEGRPYHEIIWRYSNKVPNEKIRGQITSARHYPPEQFGRGEWVAKTLDDARKMALDFAESVS
jgi:hypothetical protein